MMSKIRTSGIAAFTGAALLLAGQTQAVTVTWDGGGANDIWTTAENWSDNLAPSSGKDYVVDGATIRSPNEASNTFEGDSLTVSNSLVELFRDIGGSTGQGQTNSIPNFSVTNSTVDTWVSFATGFQTLSSGIQFSGDNLVTVGTRGGSFTYTLTLDGAITGSGELEFRRTAQGTGRNLNINGDVSGFSGNVLLTGHDADNRMAVNLNDASGWGTGNLNVNDFVNLTLSSSDIESVGSIMTLASGTSLNLNIGDHTVLGLIIDGNNVAADTYTASQLSGLGFGGSFSGDGTLTVIPEPASLVLLGIGGLLMMRRGRGR